MPAKLRLASTAAALALAAAALPQDARAADDISFSFVRTKGLAASCAPTLKATARLQKNGDFAENLRITLKGVPAGTAFDVFVLQVPNAPFGAAWYLGDLVVGSTGMVTEIFTSRLNKESFVVATGTDNAPNKHPGLDATTNPIFKPIHTYHLGIWFNSPADAVKAGCPNTKTPFNGDHTAGIQVLNTGSFPKLAGPLSKID